MISAIVNFFRSRLSPPPPLPFEPEDVPVKRRKEHGGPYRASQDEEHFTREAQSWDIISLHGHQQLLVYSWHGCREPIDYKCDHLGAPCDCDEESVMLSSYIVDQDGVRLSERDVCELYCDAADGTIIRTTSGTIYRLRGPRGYHEEWSPASIFREEGIHGRL